LRAFVTAAVRVSEDEVQEEYKRKNTTFDINYAVIASDKLASKIQVSDEDTKKYYEEHKQITEFSSRRRGFDTSTSTRRSQEKNSRLLIRSYARRMMVSRPPIKRPGSKYNRFF